MQPRHRPPDQEWQRVKLTETINYYLITYMSHIEINMRISTTYATCTVDFATSPMALPIKKPTIQVKHANTNHSEPVSRGVAEGTVEKRNSASFPPQSCTRKITRVSHKV